MTEKEEQPEQEQEQGSTVTYRFEPQEDITAYELALLMPVFITGSTDVLEELPENVRRHWVEQEGNSDAT